jgi:hypothetical protein
LFPLVIPPGVDRSGTEYQAKGRVYDTNLVRWYDKAIGPIGGWQEREMSGASVSGAPRAIIAWADNSGSRWGAIGTSSNLYAFNPDNTLTDITPSGFTAGQADSTVKTGYGFGIYGAGLYGTPRPDTGDPLPATVWDVDTWGEFLVGVSDSDGDIYEWDVDPGNDAVVITNAPTGCTGIVVTPELTLMALAPDGDPRRIEWSKPGDNTDWTPSATSRAGGFSLQTQGKLMAGRRVPGKTLILTTVDAWTATFNGNVLFYSWDQVGTGCGLIARGAVVSAGDFAVWWSYSGFCLFDSSFRQIPCEEWEYVRANLNTAQRSKISAHHNSDFNELVWDYPSQTSTENNSYLVWHYPTAADPRSFWYHGQRSRTASIGPGVFANPISVDPDGDVYDHEVGGMYDGATPYFQTGPLEMGEGDRVARVTEIISDADNVGDITMGFLTKFYPDGDETTVAQATLSGSGKTDVRFTARQAAVRAEFLTASARLGTNRLNVTLGGRR